MYIYNCFEIKLTAPKIEEIPARRMLKIARYAVPLYEQYLTIEVDKRFICSIKIN